MKEIDLSDETKLRGQLSAWDFFVLRHRKTPNLVVHFLTMILYFASPILAYLYKNPWWLIGVPLSGAIAGPSHGVFQDGGVSVREATWDPLVPFFVVIMFWRLARGKYWDDVALAEKHYEDMLQREASCAAK